MAEADTFIVVATMIATVTFASGFTVPDSYTGNCGLNHRTVTPTRKAAIQAFTITNSVAMISSTYAIFCSITKRFKHIHQLIMIASGAMCLSFTTSAHALLTHPLINVAVSLFSMGYFGYFYPFPFKGSILEKVRRKRFLDNWDLNLKSLDWFIRKAIKRPRDHDLVVFDKRESQRVVHHLPVLEILHKPPTLCHCFTFAEIQSATHDFDDKFVIGKGGFGKVYKGSFDNEVTTVAIKRLDPSSKQGGKEFWTEINMLSKFRHSHLVSLIGYCENSDEMFLIYECMHNGSMADHLHKKSNVKTSTLCWVQRLKICLGAARGLDYLHAGSGFLQRVIHRDVKSSNILLDENWAAKISDFGLSKIGPANQSCTHVSTCIKGTRGYIDPDYFLTHRLTQKSDVYAFGVVLFEVLTGRPAIDSRVPEDQRGLVAWARQCIQEDKVHNLIDPNLKWEIFPNSLKEFVKIADQCLHSRPKKRPTMSEVVASLKSALALQERKDSSILNDYDFDFGGTCDYQDKAGISPAQLGVINAGSGAFKPECMVSSTDDVDALTCVECMPKDDQVHPGHGDSDGANAKAASIGDVTSAAG